MKKRWAVIPVLALACVFARAYGLDAVQLPEPTKSGEVTLVDALSARHSARNFADVDLEPRQLSDLLWAAAGVNRPGKRVYAVARNRQDMTVYVINRQGVYRYDPEANALEPVVAGDHRAKAGTQAFVAKAAVNLAYVHDMKFWIDDAKEGWEWGYFHAGEMVQSAYLHAAGQGWSAVVRGLFDQAAMRDLLRLSGGQSVKAIQSIGPGE